MASYRDYCGVTNSRKTTCMKQLVKKYLDQWDEIFLICPTHADQELYRGWLSSDHIIDPLIACQAMSTLFRTQAGNENHVLLVLDDLLGSMNIHDGAILEQLASCGRHRQISMIVITQDFVKVAPIMRRNARYIIATEVRGSEISCIRRLCRGFDATVGGYEIQ